MTTDKVPPRVAHFLQWGCWRAGGRPDLDLFLLGSAALRGQLTGFARLWEECAPLLRRGRGDGEWFAEMVLRVRDPFKWPSHFGPDVCPEHSRADHNEGETR
jgi:hypothetical protein